MSLPSRNPYWRCWQRVMAIIGIGPLIAAMRA